MGVESNYAFALVCFTTLRDWLAKLAPPARSTNKKQSKPIVTCSHAFSRAWRRLYALALSPDWFIVLFRSVHSVAIGQSNNFGFGFTTLEIKMKTVRQKCTLLPKTINRL